MKKSMAHFLNALSENDYDILYEIMSSKYRKFIRVYWLLKDYSENITSLKYKEKSNKDVLKIAVKTSGNLNDMADELRLCILSEEDNIDIEVDDECVNITIHKSEFDA